MNQIVAKEFTITNPIIVTNVMAATIIAPTNKPIHLRVFRVIFALGVLVSTSEDTFLF